MVGNLVVLAVVDDLSKRARSSFCKRGGVHEFIHIFCTSSGLAEDGCLDLRKWNAFTRVASS